jgi:hypothetical protein
MANTDLSPCTACVEGEAMYSDGEKTYIISNEKMGQVKKDKSTQEKDLVEWYKAHADRVVENETNIPISTGILDVSNASK